MTPASLLNSVIPSELDDSVFFYASSAGFDPANGWMLKIDPNDCLVSMDSDSSAMPSVEAIRNERNAILHGVGTSIQLVNRCLFSGGALVFINNQLLLLKRDAKAPYAPLKWTAPAGRSDRDPFTTSLKEMSEEVILFDRKTQSPVQIICSNYPNPTEIERVYSQTLRRKNMDENPANWIKIQATPAPNMAPNAYPVNVQFGSDSIDYAEGEQPLFYYFPDQINNTLEFLLVLYIDSRHTEHLDLAFYDGEYDRQVKLFSEAEIIALSDNELVETMVDFKKSLSAKQ